MDTIYEPHLEEIVENNLNEGRLEFTDNIEEAINHGLIIFTAVNTPQDEAGSADLQYVVKVADAITTAINEMNIVAWHSNYCHE